MYTSSQDLTAQLELRRAGHQDLGVIAKIHKTAYSKNHFTSRLSLRTLETYYSFFLDNGSQILLAIKVEPDEKAVDCGAESILGFAVFGTGIEYQLALFKRKCWVDIAATALRHPWPAISKVLSKVYYKVWGASSDNETADFLLLSIAVSKSGNGIGALLLQQMTTTAAENRFSAVGLYVNAVNCRAINRYFSEGFIIKGFSSGQYYMEISI